VIIVFSVLLIVPISDGTLIPNVFGLTFSPINTLFSDPTASSSGFSLDVAVKDQNTAYVAICVPGGIQISRTQDSGNSWTSSPTHSFDCGNRPLIGVDNSGILYLLAQDGLRRSTDGGVSFGAVETLQGVIGENMDVTSTGDVFIVGRDFSISFFEFYLLKSIGGAPFEPRILVPPLVRSEFPDVAFNENSGILHVAWREGSCGSCVVEHLQSPDLGVTWENGQTLSSTNAEVPNIELDDSNNIVVQWRQTSSPTFPQDSFVTFSNDDGITFSSPFQVPGSERALFREGLAGDGNGEFYLLTIDAQTDVLLSISNDGGQTWDPPVVIDEPGGSVSNIRTEVDANDGLQCIAWNDNVVGADVKARCAISPPICGDLIVQPPETCDPPDGITCDAQCMFISVGGEFLGVDSTALLLAGFQANALWLIPVIVSAIGIGIVIARKF